jgi:hypothetical protein
MLMEDDRDVAAVRMRARQLASTESKPSGALLSAHDTYEQATLW